MAGRRSGKKETLRSLLAEDNPPDRPEAKDHTVISPPQTRNRTEQEKAKAKTLSPPRSGNQSPDPNCSICLGKLENKSFTDSCFHMFCFACLLEWSKVKAECPLCKQPFKSIIHNVRSYEDYDQYHIQDTQEQPELPWENPDGYRFRYRTTVTFDRLMEAHYQEQQRQLRLLQRPTMFTTRSLWRRHRQGATSEFRHGIYLNGMRVVCVTRRQTRQRKIGPAFYRNNPACTHRLVPWLNRELNALLHSQSEHVHFLMELIMDLIKRFDIDSDEFFEHLHSYLGRHTRHFIHEFINFARSPYDMIAYDERAVYEPYTETIESDNSSTFSSPGSDIIVVDEVVANPEPPTAAKSRKRSKKHSLPSDAHNPEPPEVEGALSPLVVNTSTTAISGWDSPTPGPSGLFASPVTSETVSSTAPNVVTTTPSMSTSSTLNPVVKLDDPLTGSNVLPGCQDNGTSDSDQDSDGSSVVIVKVEKPWHERTPITLSSDSEEERMIKEEIAGAKKREEARKKRQKERESRSGSGNSSSDLIDVVTVTSDKSHKKHKHSHERGKKTRKRKHSEPSENSGSSIKKSSRSSSNKEKRHSKSSKHSKEHQSRKAQHERRERQECDVWHLSPQHGQGRNCRERSPLSCVYGYEHSRNGKFGEFFQWLHYNEDRFSPERLDIDNHISSGHQRSVYSGRRGRYGCSRSRSRSFETLWPNSSRSRSPTVSISPRKKRPSSDKHSRSRRSRSSSVEIIDVVSHQEAQQQQRKSHKKHKKHKKHKHKKPKTGVCADRHIEVVELEPPEEGNSCGEMPNQSEDINNSNAHAMPSCSTHKSPDTQTKYKKHPTGHKKSSKTVKIKRDTPLMKSLQNQTSNERSNESGAVFADDSISASSKPSPGDTASVLTTPTDVINNAADSRMPPDNITMKANACASSDPVVDDENVEIDVVTCDVSLDSEQKLCDGSSGENSNTQVLKPATTESLDEELDVVSLNQTDTPSCKAFISNACSESEEIDITSCDTSREEVQGLGVSSDECPVEVANGHNNSNGEIAEKVIDRDISAKTDASADIDIMSCNTSREDAQQSDVSCDKYCEEVEVGSGRSQGNIHDSAVGEVESDVSKPSDDFDTASFHTSHRNVQELTGSSGQSPSEVNGTCYPEDKIPDKADNVATESDSSVEKSDIDRTSCDTSRAVVQEVDVTSDNVFNKISISASNKRGKVTDSADANSDESDDIDIMSEVDSETVPCNTCTMSAASVADSDNMIVKEKYSCGKDMNARVKEVFQLADSNLLNQSTSISSKPFECDMLESGSNVASQHSPSNTASSEKEEVMEYTCTDSASDLITKSPTTDTASYKNLASSHLHADTSVELLPDTKLSQVGIDKKTTVNCNNADLIAESLSEKLIRNPTSDVKLPPASIFSNQTHTGPDQSYTSEEEIDVA